MKLFILGGNTPANQALQRQLSMGGYSSEVVGQRPQAGTANAAQHRRMVMRLITECDAVAVPPGALDSGDLARLAVVCEFAGKLLLLTDHLPTFAPEELDGLKMYAVNTPVRCTWMAVPEVGELPAPGRVRVQELVRRARAVLERLEQRANRVLGHSLKNPATRPVRYGEPPRASTTG